MGRHNNGVVKLIDITPIDPLKLLAHHCASKIVAEIPNSRRGTERTVQPRGRNSARLPRTRFTANQHS